MEVSKIIVDARPPAIRVAQTIIFEADNQKEHPQGDFCCTVAHLAFQNIIVNACLTISEPGSALGEKTIRDFYESSLKDTIERWHMEDLKANFGGN